MRLSEGGCIALDCTSDRDFDNLRESMLLPGKSWDVLRSLRYSARSCQYRGDQQLLLFHASMVMLRVCVWGGGGENCPAPKKTHVHSEPQDVPDLEIESLQINWLRGDHSRLGRALTHQMMSL